MIPVSTPDSFSARRKIVYSRAGHRSLRGVLCLALIFTTAWLSISCGEHTNRTGNTLAVVSDTVGLPAKRLAYPAPAWNMPVYNYNQAADSSAYPVFFPRPQGHPGRITAPASPYRINADTLRKRRVDASRNTPDRG